MLNSLQIQSVIATAMYPSTMIHSDFLKIKVLEQNTFFFQLTWRLCVAWEENRCKTSQEKLLSKQAFRVYLPTNEHMWLRHSRASKNSTNTKCTHWKLFGKIEDITWPRVDMNFIFECSTRYLTSERSKRVRCRVEHEKIKFISTSGHVIFCLLHKHTNDDVFEDFPKISDQLPKISEDFPKFFRI